MHLNNWCSADIVSVSAVSSLEKLPPGKFVIVDNL